MAYNRTTWKDRKIQRPNTFNISNNPDGTVTLMPVTGTVTEPGTPINATNMNKIELGVASVELQLAENTLKISKNDWMSEILTGSQIVAHRGLSAYYPENTLKAYYEARNYKGWECDPYLTIDSEWVNMHDETVDRTTDGVGNVTSLTLAQVKNLVIDGGVNASIYKGLKVPTIEDIYILASKMKNKPVIFLNSRSKLDGNIMATEKLVNIIKKYNYEKRTIFFMNDYPSWDIIRSYLPNIGLAFDQWNLVPDVSRLEMLKTYTPNVLMSFDKSVLLGASGPNVMKLCNDRGILIQAQNVTDDISVNKLSKIGVNTIMHDGGIWNE